MLIPQVVGIKLTGELPEGSTADLVLTVAEMLRRTGVVASSSSLTAPASQTRRSQTAQRWVT